MSFYIGCTDCLESQTGICRSCYNEENEADNKANHQDKTTISKVGNYFLAEKRSGNYFLHRNEFEVFRTVLDTKWLKKLLEKDDASVIGAPLFEVNTTIRCIDSFKNASVKW